MVLVKVKIHAVKFVGEGVGKGKDRFEFVGVKAACAGLPVDKAVHGARRTEVEHVRFRIVDVEHRRALRELFQRVFYLVRRPGLVAPDNFAFARCAHDLKARRKLIELAVCFDRVQDAFHKLIRRYRAVRVQIRQQILQKALDRVLRHGKLSAGDVDEVGKIAGQKLRIELQKRGRAILGV